MRATANASPGRRSVTHARKAGPKAAAENAGSRNGAPARMAPLIQTVKKVTTKSVMWSHHRSRGAGIRDRISTRRPPPRSSAQYRVPGQDASALRSSGDGPRWSGCTTASTISRSRTTVVRQYRRYFESPLTWLLDDLSPQP
jgi:hypothetical protein